MLNQELRLTMIYANQMRAEQVAAELNSRLGYAPSYAVECKYGWTVICSYRGREHAEEIARRMR